MNIKSKGKLVFFFLFLSFNLQSFENDSGYISGRLILDDTWERRVYLSLIETFEKEYAISNNAIIASATVDSLGNFKIELNNVPAEWTLLRLHIVKKGVSPNTLIIGSRDENFYFLIAKQNSRIELSNTHEKPIFKNVIMQGAPYMSTFEYIRKLANYPNSIDYENSIIEKDFINEVVSDRLKIVADSTNNLLVSLYALYQTDFQSDYKQNTSFYENYISKWKNEKNTYFESFKLKIPITHTSTLKQNPLPKYMLLFVSLGIIVLLGFYVYKKRTQRIKTLSIQERKIFELIRNGLTNKEISTHCNIEITTVKSHVNSIYSKLNIKSRKEAINLKM